ncbi:MAG: hypothetical protein LBG76_07160 [Treponema sp.]|jgi:hypothetical protein|nr:hypothetical protein [Treponema sp.]
MKKNSVSRAAGMAAGVLAFGLSLMVLAGCDNVTQVEGKVDTNAPEVGLGEIDAVPNEAGVTLSWAASADVESYKVYRREENKADTQLTGNQTVDAETGKKVYNDIADASNKLENGKSYIYTVVATPYSGSLNISKREKKVTLENVAAKGAQVAKPAGVDFEFDEDNNQIKVTVTPPAAGIIPTSYTAQLYRGSNTLGSATITAPATTGAIYWASIQESSYTVKVTGKAGSDGYFKASDEVSAAKTYTALFSTSATISGYAEAVTSNAVITGAAVRVSFSGQKTGVTYSYERALLNADGLEGAWTAISLKAESAGDTALPGPDALGNLPAYGYDQNVPSGAYKYRIKAEKAGQSPQYKTSSTVTVDKTAFINGYISMNSPVTSGSLTTYAVAPYFSQIKGALAEGDKLVIYWSTTSRSSDYNNKIEFTKAELEAATVQPKNLSVNVNSSAYNRYAQAYIETAAGERRNVSDSGFYWSSGGGNYSPQNYWNEATEQYIYYVQLYY